MMEMYRAKAGMKLCTCYNTSFLGLQVSAQKVSHALLYLINVSHALLYLINVFGFLMFAYIVCFTHALLIV